jgi:hypothetical protein
MEVGPAAGLIWELDLSLDLVSLFLFSLGIPSDFATILFIYISFMLW